MIPVNTPIITKESEEYVLDCIKTGWISSQGSYVTRFEKEFANYIGVKYATTVSNGTTALHLACRLLDIGPGDEVILPDLTIISCINAVWYTGATPVLVDIDPETFTMNPDLIEEKITKKTKAIMPVHLYGHPVDMDPIIKLAKKYRLKIIEDAAEAHGAEYKGRKCGSMGDIGVFSFYPNKLITSGEGGMVVTNNEKIYNHATKLKDLSHSPKKRFKHFEIGYNYRMTNMQAALGCAQMKHVDEFFKKKMKMAKMYNEGLAGIKGLHTPITKEWAKNSYWMYAITLDRSFPYTRDEFKKKLFKNGVDTRDFFYPLHSQPIFKKMEKAKGKFPVSDKASREGFYLPSGLALTEEQINTVIKTVIRLSRDQR